MYNLIAIAGTFDRLHRGHQFFISQAFKFGGRVVIGLTSDDFAEKKIKRSRHLGGGRMDSPEVEGLVKPKIQNYDERKKELESFLEKEGLLKRAEIVKIDDVYGPACRQAGRRGKTEIEALVVTKETLEGARLVNKKRKRLGLSPLKILQVPLIAAEDKKRLASTRIRVGEIDRWGKLFISRITSHVSRINEELRQELKKPQGILIKGDSQNLPKIIPELKSQIVRLQPLVVITVGDEVTKLCNEIGITINLAIFDYKVGRKVKYSSFLDLGFKSTFARVPLANAVVTVRNPAGNITKSLTHAVYQVIKKVIASGQLQIVRVLGEEDLAGVPAILLSPLGSIVLYGQPGEGVVVVEVTEGKKGNLLKLIELD